MHGNTESDLFIPRTELTRVFSGGLENYTGRFFLADLTIAIDRKRYDLQVVYFGEQY